MKKTDYDKIASSYNKRYSANRLVNIERELKTIIEQNKFKKILEVGCGTGRWIRSLDLQSAAVLGLDYSYNMLKIARQEDPKLNIINADADSVPFKDNSFDLIFCVNAIHHFPDKEKFIRECERTLINNSMLAVFSIDPHIDNDWYVYKYFDNVFEIELNRFPSNKNLVDLLKSNGFENINIKPVEKVIGKRIGKDVFNDLFLDKSASSQLANLTDDEYHKGISKINKQIEIEPDFEFNTNFIFYLISGVKSKGR